MVNIGTWVTIGVLLAAGATAAELEHLGQPCRAKNILSGRVVVDRTTGREMLVLGDTNEGAGLELIFLDYERNTGKSYRAPAGSGSWALNEVPGDRLVIGTHYDGRFIVFDLKKMEFIGTAAFPGESYIWNLALGSDGRVYGGTYPGAKLGALDLETLKVEDCGAPAPPNLYLRYVSATPDGRILCSFGQEKPDALLYDPATKQFSPLPEQLAGVSVGVVWNGYFLAGAGAYKGGSFEVVDPAPFPTPPAEKGGWSVDTYMTAHDTLFLRQGKALYRYAKGAKELTLVAEVDLKGGRTLAGNSTGEVLGIRGQDYFVLKPGDQQVRLKRIPTESGPRPTLFLEADPEGKLWGGPHFGQTLFYLDPKTKRMVNTGTIVDGGGEVYDVAFHDGKTYAVSYAGGDITRYDPDEPWDQWNHRNPQSIARVSTSGYIRPIAGVMLGPDGKLYSGWMARYGTYGGAVAVTDPATGETDLIENPLGEQAVAGLAVDRKYAYIGTSLAGNGLPNKKGESSKFGMVGLGSRRVVYEKAFEGVTTVRVPGYDSKSARAAVSLDGRLLLFDSNSREFVSGLPDLPRLTCNSTAMNDGKLYYGSEKLVFALDMLTGEALKIAEAPAKITNVALGPDGRVYISVGVDVYAVR